MSSLPITSMIRRDPVAVKRGTLVNVGSCRPRCAPRNAAALRAVVCSASDTKMKRVTLSAQLVTADNFRPFGQLVGPTHDGKEFDDEDAKLQLDAGTPRFYIMRLPERGLVFDRITYHAKVTQCLGGLGSDWFMAVARPTMSLEQYPREQDLAVFRVPPGVFLKMEAGTWHAGPLFEGCEHMDFYNLELSDTNVVDHNTHVYAAQGIEFEVRP